jgi:hypothetical protein
LPILQTKSEGLDQVQAASGDGAQADYVARIGRDLGLEQDDIEHGGVR